MGEEQQMKSMDHPPDPTDEEAREAYLRRLRNEINEGLYKVPADWIAEKIIETELKK